LVIHSFGLIRGMSRAGWRRRSGEFFSYVDLEARPRKDPLRSIRPVVNEALSAMEREFAALYAPIGRPSIPSEKLLPAMFLQAFHSMRSERQMMERSVTSCSRRFSEPGIDDAVWDHSTFSKNHDRLLEGDNAAKFLAAVLSRPRVKKLLSTDHFSVDGTLNRPKWRQRHSDDVSVNEPANEKSYKILDLAHIPGLTARVCHAR